MLLWIMTMPSGEFSQDAERYTHFHILDGFSYLAYAFEAVVHFVGLLDLRASVSAVAPGSLACRTERGMCVY